MFTWFSFWILLGKLRQWNEITHKKLVIMRQKKWNNMFWNMVWNEKEYHKEMRDEMV